MAHKLMPGRLSTARWALLVIVVIVALVVALPRDKPICSETYVKNNVLTVQASDVKLNAETANSEADRERGLSGRKCIPEHAAMLFTFGVPGYYGIWMKDMRFNIDIIWLDNAKIVTKIEKNVSPDSYPYIYTPNDLSRYVLELHDGSADTLGLKVGSSLSW